MFRPGKVSECPLTFSGLCPGMQYDEILGQRLARILAAGHLSLEIHTKPGNMRDEPALGITLEGHLPGVAGPGQYQYAGLGLAVWQGPVSFHPVEESAPFPPVDHDARRVD